MYAIGFEDATDDIKAAITEYCPILNKLAKDAANGGGGKALETWFGSEGKTPQMRAKLIEFDRFLNEQCMRLTFVVKPLGATVDCAEVVSGDMAQVIRNLPGDDGKHFLPSGIRVFILPRFAAKDRSERFNTIAHEVSHRVLGTTDCPVMNGTPTQTYGRRAALSLAASNGAAAMTCAENWGYFFMDLLGTA
jgi:hypothetical protein